MFHIGDLERIAGNARTADFKGDERHGDFEPQADIDFHIAGCFLCRCDGDVQCPRWAGAGKARRRRRVRGGDGHTRDRNTMIGIKKRERFVRREFHGCDTVPHMQLRFEVGGIVLAGFKGGKGDGAVIPGRHAVDNGLHH